MSSKIPRSSFSRTDSPHSRSASQESLVTENGGLEENMPRLHRVPSRNIPRLEGSNGASPLAKVGIKGDGLMLFVTCFASLGVFLFGYDQGVMSGIITGPYFKSYFHQPTSYEIGTMVAILEVGAFFTSLACGVLADVFGRKKTLLAGAVVFSIGGAMQTFTTGFNSMVAGRVVAGFGVGILSMIVPTYQAEISSAEARGKLACIEFTGNIIGYCSSIWVDYFFSFFPSDLSWRLPLSIQVIIGVILAIGSLMLPESPRWLLDQDKDIEGMKVLADLHGGGDPRDPKARLEFREIKENVLSVKEHDRSYSAMWKNCKYRVLIACSSQMFAQLNGINVVSYYAPLIFESAGWVGRDAILMAGINGVIYVLATIPTWFMIDTVGRRLILLTGSIVMSIALSLCGFFLYLEASYTPQAVVGCVIAYNAVFGTGWGPIPWMYPPEIFPNLFRSKGTSASTATNWIFNFIVGELTPILQEKIGWRLYPMHAFFCLLSFAVVYFTYPETAGVPLEEMDALFGEKIVGEGVPQGDDSDEEEDEPQPRAIRRSISSHPRFQSEEERAARVAAARVAAESGSRKWTFDPRGWFGRMTGYDANQPDRRLYETVAGSE